MKRSDVFNRRFPAPLDFTLYRHYDAYNALLEEIGRNWRDEVIKGGLIHRGYHDIFSARVETTSSGQPIVRLIPFIGDDTKTQLDDYHYLFTTYRMLTDFIVSIARKIEDSKWQTKIINDKEDAKPEILEAVHKDLVKSLKPELHRLVMGLKFMVSLLNMNLLDMKEVYRFRDLVDDDVKPQDADEAINQLLRDVELPSHLISTQFDEGKASFFAYPDERLVSGYWNYGRDTGSWNHQQNDILGHAKSR